MKNSKSILKLVTLSMLIALGVVISPILRVEGMCPMAHFINITCSVFLGPWYSLLCAVLIGVIRMATMAIPPLALTGAVFGAFLSGVFYRLSKGKDTPPGGLFLPVRRYPFYCYFFPVGFLCFQKIFDNIGKMLRRQLMFVAQSNKIIDPLFHRTDIVDGKQDTGVGNFRFIHGYSICSAADFAHAVGFPDGSVCDMAHFLLYHTAGGVGGTL